MTDLKEIRARLGLTGTQMAAVLGIANLSNYKRLESGRRKPTKQLRKAIKNVIAYHKIGNAIDLVGD